jgi:hypothetical protein
LWADLSGNNREEKMIGNEDILIMEKINGKGIEARDPVKTHNAANTGAALTVSLPLMKLDNSTEVVGNEKIYLLDI